MFVAASSHCFAEKPFFETCHLLTDLEFDKIELWMSESGEHLRPAELAADPDRFVTRYRETTRLSPVAFVLAEDVTPETLSGLSKTAKLLRVTQITVPASPLGTPFNTEIDRLKEFVQIVGQDGVRLSITTRAGQLSEDLQTAVELCQSVRGLGLTFDPSYTIFGPRHGQSYDAVLPYVYHVHLRDTSADELQVPVGLGVVDYSRLIQQLQRAGYRGALTVDILPEHAPEDSRPLELRKLRMLLDTLL